MMHAVLSIFITITPVCEVVVTNYSGDDIVIGRGETCQAAMAHRKPFPVAWREMSFREYTVIE